MSPSMAKLADTPPKVWSVKTDIYGSLKSDKRPKAALVFDICSSDIKDSCIRAPPHAEKHTSPHFSAIAVSTAATNRAPTTDPIDPAMNENSKAQVTIGNPYNSPFNTISASFSPGLFLGDL